MLEGKNVSLKIMEKEDLPQFAEWVNQPELLGEFNGLMHLSKSEIEKMLENQYEMKYFMIEKKGGSARTL